MPCPPPLPSTCAQDPSPPQRLIDVRYTDQDSRIAAARDFAARTREKLFAQQQQQAGGRGGSNGRGGPSLRLGVSLLHPAEGVGEGAGEPRGKRVRERDSVTVAARDRWGRGSVTVPFSVAQHSNAHPTP